MNAPTKLPHDPQLAAAVRDILLPALLELVVKDMREGGRLIAWFDSETPLSGPWEASA